MHLYLNSINKIFFIQLPITFSINNKTKFIKKHLLFFLAFTFIFHFTNCLIYNPKKSPSIVGFLLGGFSADETNSIFSKYSINVHVTGLLGTGLVLQNNGGDDLLISMNGNFNFPTKLLTGIDYSITILNQPSSPTQICSVSSGTGRVNYADVTTIVVNCNSNAYTISVNVSGLVGSGFVLRNNGGDDLSITTNGSATFATALPPASLYGITVHNQPNTPAQTCTVTSGSGSMPASNLTGIAIACTTNTFSLGGNITGFSPIGFSSDLILYEENSGQTISIPPNSTNYSFATGILPNDNYVVRVNVQPNYPFTCSLENASGTISNNVSNINVKCVNGLLQSGTIISGSALSFPTGLLTTIAGSYPVIIGAGTDGIGLASRFSDPRSITTDGSNLYISDSYQRNIRKMNLSNGMVSTLFTLPNSGEPYGLTTDGVFLYIADRVNHAIFKLHLSTNNFSLVAGGNNAGVIPGAGGSASTCSGSNATTCLDGIGEDARFNEPRGLVVVGGFLYVSDYFNDRIRRVNIATGSVTTYFGSGATALLNGPDGITAVGSILFVSDFNNNRILRIDNPATSSPLFALNGPRGIGTDGFQLFASGVPSNELVNYNSLITGGTITQIAGGDNTTGLLLDGIYGVSKMYNPGQIVSDGIRIYVVEVDSNTVRKYE
jgi:hypothetical protein